MWGRGRGRGRFPHLTNWFTENLVVLRSTYWIKNWRFGGINWWAKLWGTEMTGWWSIQKTYSHNLLLHFILMIRLQNWQNCLWSIGEWHFIRNLKENNTSPFRFKLINTWIIPLIIVQKCSKFCKGSLDQTLTTIWWRRIIFKNTRTNHG